MRDHQPATPLETPCVDICLLDPEAGLCLGCGRSIHEIAGWAAMSDGERRAIMVELPRRMQRLKAARVRASEGLNA